MNTSDFLKMLNEAQREAVTAPADPVLVLAGAGSGKTRVLVHRIAWLIEHEHVSPFAILAVTFTNKAAGEMRSRIDQLVGNVTQGMWVGTFHGLAHRLLRIHWEAAGLPQAFQILDSDDQLRIVKRVLKEMGEDDETYAPKSVQWYINGCKDKGLRANQLGVAENSFERQLAIIYENYEQVCQRSGLVDFSELLLRVHELLSKNETLLAHYRERFEHLLVDEFQDTNVLQYNWLRQLVGARTALFVVGDDDQSIYGWRGAQVENLQHFCRDYPQHHLIRLEQNYRSTGIILAAANALIAKNDGRLGKTLWTEGADGEEIQLYAANDERDEVDYTVRWIKSWVEQGNLRSDVGILYRSNAQSRLFEEALVIAGIPYRVYGGQRFFDRAEIKDALAYMRLMFNRDDDAAFARIINRPVRGIGQRTLDTIYAMARNERLSLWLAAKKVMQQGQLKAKAGAAVAKFFELIMKIAEQTQGIALAECVSMAILESGLRDMHEKDGSEKGQMRVDNLDELVNAARQFAQEVESDNEQAELTAFLASAALDAGEGQAQDNDDCVQLMTLHASKGLEFPLVFLAGMEEGLFPHQQSIEDATRLEEERRLCYVGMTRAMKKLYLTYAEVRRSYGRGPMTRRPSRFLSEIPQEYLHEARPKLQFGRPAYAPFHKSHDSSVGGFAIGQRVSHKKFGEGVVLNHDGGGNHARIQVHFELAGSKWLILSYANLEAVGS